MTAKAGSRGTMEGEGRVGGKEGIKGGKEGREGGERRRIYDYHWTSRVRMGLVEKGGRGWGFGSVTGPGGGGEAGSGLGSGKPPSVFRPVYAYSRQLEKSSTRPSSRCLPGGCFFAGAGPGGGGGVFCGWLKGVSPSIDF